MNTSGSVSRPPDPVHQQTGIFFLGCPSTFLSNERTIPWVRLPFLNLQPPAFDLPYQGFDGCGHFSLIGPRFSDRTSNFSVGIFTQLILKT